MGFLIPLRLFVFALVLATAVGAGSPALAADAHSDSVATSVGIQGYWDSNIGVHYEIAQHGNTFIWMAKQIQERGQGTIDGTTMHASWKGMNGAGTGLAVIKVIDSDGNAHRIEWSNGVVFTRNDVRQHN